MNLLTLENAKLEGSEITCLDKVGEYGERGDDDDDDDRKKNLKDDDYVLRKLFKKSGDYYSQLLYSINKYSSPAWSWLLPS